MQLPRNGLLLRIFIGESDRWHGAPLYEAVVKLAKERGLAGATVLRGICGYGAHSRIHTAKILQLSMDLPIVIEIVDRTERIEGFLPELDAMIQEGLVTLEKVQILKYRHRSSK